MSPITMASISPERLRSEIFFGDSNGTTFTGGGGNDIVIANGGDDTITTGTGNDIIVGGGRR